MIGRDERLHVKFVDDFLDMNPEDHAPKHVPSHVTHRMPDHVSHHVPDHVSHHVPDHVSHHVPDHLFRHLPRPVSHHVPLPNPLVHHVADHVIHHLPHHVSHHVPDYVIPLRMTQSLCTEEELLKRTTSQTGSSATGSWTGSMDSTEGQPQLKKSIRYSENKETPYLSSIYLYL